MDRLKEYQTFAIELADKSAQMMRDAASQEFSVDTKRSRRDMVTEFDKAIEAYIFNSLRERYPEHNFIGEESSGTSNRLEDDRPTWIVDPIDGTMNFVHRYPLCCVSIGLAINKEMVMGVIKAPFIGKLYTAIKGKGAQCNGVPIRVSSAKRIDESLILSEIAMGIAPGQIESSRGKYLRRLYDNVLWKCHSVRMIGSSCICLAMIAEGAGDVFFHVGLCIWDMAAGYVIVTEAGGTVLTINGDLFDPNSRSCLAASSNELAQEVAQFTAITTKTTPDLTAADH